MRKSGEISPNARIAGQNNTADTDDFTHGRQPFIYPKSYADYSIINVPKYGG